MKNKKMNVEDLRNSLIETFESLKSGEIGIKDAKAQADVANQIIISAKVELSHKTYFGDRTKIEFLDTTKKADK